MRQNTNRVIDGLIGDLCALFNQNNKGNVDFVKMIALPVNSGQSEIKAAGLILL